MENTFFIPKDQNLLDPTLDSTFKTLFTKSSQGSKHALKSLVRAITGFEPSDVQVINNELPKEYFYAKDIRLDLQCKMTDGSRIDIEMQTCPDGDNLALRSLYYACRMVSGLDTKGETYQELSKVYQVMFTDFRMFKESDDYLQRFTLKNDALELCDNLQIIFIQMPLFKDMGKENFTDMEKWIIFLKESTNKDKRDLLNSIIESDEGIREAGEILMTISAEEREWALQEMRFKGKRDYESGLLAAKREGIAEGKMEDARGMKAENIPLETIVKITGLSAEQVAAL